MIRKARKDHECVLCREVITKGLNHETRRITPWDHQENDVFWTFRAHEECYSVWCEVDAYSDGDLPDPFEFKQDLEASRSAAAGGKEAG